MDINSVTIEKIRHFIDVNKEFSLQNKSKYIFFIPKNNKWEIDSSYPDVIESTNDATPQEAKREALYLYIAEDWKLTEKMK